MHHPSPAKTKTGPNDRRGVQVLASTLHDEADIRLMDEDENEDEDESSHFQHKKVVTD